MKRSKFGPTLRNTTKQRISLGLSIRVRWSTQPYIFFVLFPRLTGSVRRQGNYNEARKIFTKAAKFPLDWPEMLWETWLSFEHSHGSAKEVQNALDIVERARTQVEARRAKVVLLSSLEQLSLSDDHIEGG